MLSPSLKLKLLCIMNNIPFWWVCICSRLIPSSLSTQICWSQNQPSWYLVMSKCRWAGFLWVCWHWFSTEIQQEIQFWWSWWGRNEGSQIFLWSDSMMIWWVWLSYWQIESCKGTSYKTRRVGEWSIPWLFFRLCFSMKSVLIWGLTFRFTKILLELFSS